jgi:hypothetical protein
MFVGRDRELDQLKKVEKDLLRGKPSVLIIAGMEGWGKTSLLKRFADSLSDAEPVYIDIATISLSPDLFCLHFIGNIFWRLAEEREDERLSYFEIRFQRKVVSAIGDREISEGFGRFYNSLEKEDRNWADLIQQTFALVGLLAERLSLRLIILLDNFSELLFLSNYQIEPFSLFKKSTAAKRVSWICAGDKISLLKERFREIIFLKGLTKEETKRLVFSLLSSTHFDDDVVERIWQIAEGNPNIVTILSKRLIDLYIESKRKLDIYSVDEAFFCEFSEGGDIHRLCLNLVEKRISAARGEGLLRAVLAILAKRENTTLASVAKDLRRQSGVTRNLLIRLMDVDLVDQRERAYYIPDKILRWWIRRYYYGIKPEIPDIRKEPKKRLTEILVELLNRFSGQKIEGELFGIEEEVTLPRFHLVRLIKREIDTAQIEALSEREGWLVIVSLKEEPVTPKEIDMALREREKRGYRVWFVAKAGFSSDVIISAKGHLMLSIKEDIEALSERVGVGSKFSNIL